MANHTLVMAPFVPVPESAAAPNGAIGSPHGPGRPPLGPSAPGQEETSGAERVVREAKLDESIRKPRSGADKLAEILAQKQASLDWMQTSFYAEWEQVYKNYKCISAEIAKARAQSSSYSTGQQVKGAPTPLECTEEELVQVGMPDTWRSVRTVVARVTAALPALKFRCNDPQAAEQISMKVMYDWDQGGVQRLQKKHVLQAVLFGWSVRPWYWRYETFNRIKRVNPLRPRSPEEARALAGDISRTYDIPVENLVVPMPQPMDGPPPDPGTPPPVQLNPQAMSFLMAKNSRGGMLPVKYSYRSYEGAAADFLFVGDCFPQPNFQDLQSQKAFIVERRRDLNWILRTADAYPELASGLAELVKSFPNGTQLQQYASDTTRFRWQLQSVVNQTEPAEGARTPEGAMWTVTECHYPGPKPRLAFVGEETVWIGEIPYPYELQGQIAFTDCVLIDDIISGIGDSTARIIAPLNQLHNTQTSLRFKLVNNILRPLVGTSNRELYENPNLLKRYQGFRLVWSRPNEVWVVGEQAAIAAAAAGMNDESAILRAMQMGTGETNMSMAANVDPAQGRTATGARIMAYNTDILTKDLQDMLVETSIKRDAQMIYLLNRSEMSEDVEVDSARYTRYDPTGRIDRTQAVWLKITPESMQADAMAEPMVNSVLADDDDSNVEKAREMWMLANQRPDLISVEKARDDLLTAMGKGREIQQWVPPPPPPPGPPEPKSSIAVSIKLETLSSDRQNQVLDEVLGPLPETTGMGPEDPGPGNPMTPGGAPPTGGAPQMPAPESPEYSPGSSSYAAAKGVPLTQQGG